MNLLKKAIINGEISFMYASVSIQYIFSASDEKNISPRFFLPVPENACITGFSILGGNKRLIRSEIGSRAETEFESGIKITQVDSKTCCLSWSEMPDAEEYIFSVDMLVRLLPRGNSARLHLPFGIHKTSVGSVKLNASPFELTLYVRPGMVTGSSVTHEVVAESYESETVFTCSGFMGKDFIFDITTKDVASYSMVQESLYGGLGLYRIFLQDKGRYVREKKKLVLMLDLTEGISERKLNAVKELLHKTLTKIPDGIEMQILTADNIDSDFYSMLKMAEKYRLPNTEMILFSGGSPVNFRYALNNSQLKTVHLFTIGDFAQTEFSASFKRKFSGIHEHFYERDRLEERISIGLKRVLESGDEISVTVENSSVNEVMVLSGTNAAADGYIDALVSYTGVQPQVFSVWQNGAVKETTIVSPAVTYQSLPDIERIFAMERTNRLYRLLERTSPASVRTIKEQLEEIGIKYGILNSETTLLIKGENNEGRAVELCSAVSDGLSEFANRPTMFGQRDDELYLRDSEKEHIIDICKGILSRNIRKSGVVTDKVCKRDKINDTVYAMTAFYLMEEPELTPIIEDAKVYLNGKQLTGFANILYSHADNTAEFLKKNGDMVSANLPSFKELAENNSVLSAAQMVLRIHI